MTISNPTIEKFLKQVQVAVLSTVDGKGHPHAAPMWCLYDSGEFLMVTGPGSQKYKNMKNNNEVVLVFDHRDPPYYAVMAHGVARLEITPCQDARRKIATAYLGKEGADHYFANSRSGDLAVIRVIPKRFIEYHGISGN